MKKIYLVPTIKKNTFHGNDDLLVSNVGSSKGGSQGSSGVKERGEYSEVGGTDFWGNSSED